MEQQQEDENSWMEKRKAALSGEALCLILKAAGDYHKSTQRALFRK